MATFDKTAFLKEIFDAVYNLNMDEYDVVELLENDDTYNSMEIITIVSGMFPDFAEDHSTIMALHDEIREDSRKIRAKCEEALKSHLYMKIDYAKFK